MITLVDYDPCWAEQFTSLSRTFEAKLSGLLVGIEHIGSTSVVGLSAKPVIDIDIVVADRSALQRTIYLLSELGYDHQGDLGIPSREAFIARDRDVPYPSAPVHHLYACTRDSPELARHLHFRSSLQTDSDLSNRYAELKRRLAARHSDDRAAYSRGKSEFVEEVLRRTPWIDASCLP